MTQILKDLSPSGKERKFGKKKTESLSISDALEKAYLDNPNGHLKPLYKLKEKIDRFRSCSSFLKFKSCDQCHRKLKWASFCRLRLCLMCAWMKGRLMASNVSKVTHYLDFIDDRKSEYILLTLTTPSVPLNLLSNEIDKLLKGFSRLIRTRKFKASVDGFFRNLEVTFNFTFGNKSYETANPHIHVLIKVSSSYFSGHAYLSHGDWLELWREAAQNEEIKVVDVRRVKPKKDTVTGEDNFSGAAFEVVGYTFKGSDIENLDIDKRAKAAICLEEALYGRRLYAWGGDMKKGFQFLNLVDADKASSEDLVKAGDEEPCTCSICGGGMIYDQIFGYQGNIKNYGLIGGLSDEEIKKQSKIEELV